MGLKIIFVNETKYGQIQFWFQLEKIGFSDH